MNARLGDLLRDDQLYFAPDHPRPFIRARGLGLMWGFQFRTAADAPHPQWRDAALHRLYEQNIFTAAAGMANINPAIRLMPALNVDRETLEFLAGQFVSAIAETRPQ